jgi:hypothetical protein
MYVVAEFSNIDPDRSTGKGEEEETGLSDGILLSILTQLVAVLRSDALRQAHLTSAPPRFENLTIPY